MIVCPRCGKDNQDHYKFCLGCGAELPRDQVGPKNFSAPQPSNTDAPPVGGSPSAPPRDKSFQFAATHQGDLDLSPEEAAAVARSGLGAPEVDGYDDGYDEEEGVGETTGPQPGYQPSAAASSAFMGAPAERDNMGGSNRPLVRAQSSRPPAPEVAVGGGGAAIGMAGGMAGGMGGHSSPMAVAEVTPASAPQNPPTPVLAMRDCPACGDPVPADFRFCGSCGQRMDSSVGAPAPRAAAAPRQEPGPVSGALILINPDGSEGVTFQLTGYEVTVGRNAGPPFAGDSYLSPVHATFTFTDGVCVVRDEDSLNGVYYKIPRDMPVPLRDGSIFRIGQEILEFTNLRGGPSGGSVETMGSPNPGYLGRVSLVIGRRTYGNSFLVPQDGAHIGRERGDVVFPEDGYVSGLHCRISGEQGRTMLTDVGSSNGTFMRLQGEHSCRNGELLLMGQQLFRLQF